MRISRRTAGKGLLAAATGGWALGHRSTPAEQLAAGAAGESLQTEVCVIGGGSAGCGAALAAASAGARVVLVESESILGGTSTNA